MSHPTFEGLRFWFAGERDDLIEGRFVDHVHMLRMTVRIGDLCSTEVSFIEPGGHVVRVFDVERGAHIVEDPPWFPVDELHAHGGIPETENL